MRRFSHELDRVFEEFGLKPRFAEPVVDEAAWAPDLDDYYQSERSYGAFHRTFVLPEGVKAEQVQATFKNGVLEVTMPLAMAEKKIKTIDVKVA